MNFEVVPDCFFQFASGAIGASANLLFSQSGEPAFHLVKPRSRGRGEVNVKSRMAGKLRLDSRRLVRAVVVHLLAPRPGVLPDVKVELPDLAGFDALLGVQV